MQLDVDPSLKWLLAATIVVYALVMYWIGWESFLEPLGLLGGWQLPVSLSATFCALVAYFVIEPPWRIAWCRS